MITINTTALKSVFKSAVKSTLRISFFISFLLPEESDLTIYNLN